MIIGTIVTFTNVLFETFPFLKPVFVITCYALKEML